MLAHLAHARVKVTSFPSLHAWGRDGCQAIHSLVDVDCSAAAPKALHMRPRGAVGCASVGILITHPDFKPRTTPRRCAMVRSPWCAAPCFVQLRGRVLCMYDRARTDRRCVRGRAWFHLGADTVPECADRRRTPRSFRLCAEKLICTCMATLR